MRAYQLGECCEATCIGAFPVYRRVGYVHQIIMPLKTIVDIHILLY